VIVCSFSKRCFLWCALALVLWRTKKLNEKGRRPHSEQRPSPGDFVREFILSRASAENSSFQPGHRGHLLPGWETAAFAAAIGVVGDVRDFDITTPTRPAVYFPISQFDAQDGLLRDWVVRIQGNPNALVPVVRKAIWSIDRDLPISRVRTMEQVRSFSLASEQFNVVLLGLFACLALVLASAGIYGVTAYAIAQRTHEIGIRVALGAQHKDVLKLILGQGTRLACIGSVIGLAGSLVLTRLMSSVVYEVRTTDPLSLVGAAIMLGLVALTACYLPARDAMRIDPITALRHE